MGLCPSCAFSLMAVIAESIQKEEIRPWLKHVATIIKRSLLGCCRLITHALRVSRCLIFPVKWSCYHYVLAVVLLYLHEKQVLKRHFQYPVLVKCLRYRAGKKHGHGTFSWPEGSSCPTFDGSLRFVICHLCVLILHSTGTKANLRTMRFMDRGREPSMTDVIYVQQW